LIFDLSTRSYESRHGFYMGIIHLDINTYILDKSK